ncbi:hypothetical protein C7212DRAFT_321577 [Tuber magnatum]|uniref:Uncharacterized protein n=1 Tax=Tuber magnatum TaxID=42249 RepID=A0A317SN03_9PEZI|nr:hypothetical protein C7212DRAFT_321577 [Tuber magnatum]
MKTKSVKAYESSHHTTKKVPTQKRHSAIPAASVTVLYMVTIPLFQSLDGMPR